MTRGPKRYSLKVKKGTAPGEAASILAAAARRAAPLAFAALVVSTAACSRSETGSDAGRSPSSPSEEISSSPSLPFVPLSFDEALAKARAENKLVLVDVYTDWCGWCTKMDRDVFADARVQAALLGFVPIRVNADKGGRGVAARYRVRGLPTFLVVDADGTVVRRFEGYLPVDAFLSRLGPASGARS